MYIKEINIISFGGITNKQFEFSNGLNVLYGANESGKSTLLAFIKYVFYGISGRKNEFKRYIPLSGEAMRGSIIVCDDETDYEIYRTSKGAKVKQVTVTNLTSGETENTDFAQGIGKNLFLLGEEAFLNTLFVTNISNKISGGDGEIFSLLSNLTESGDESISYEKISEKIENDILNLSSPRRKNAEIPILEAQISNLNDRYILALASEEKYEQLKKALNNKKELLNEKKAKKSEYDEKKENAQFFENYKRLEALKLEKEKFESEYSALQTEFSSIDMSKFDKIKDISSEDEKKFLTGSPTEGDAQILILEERIKNTSSKKKSCLGGIVISSVLILLFAFLMPLLCVFPAICAAICAYFFLAFSKNLKTSLTEKEKLDAKKEENTAIVSNFLEKTLLSSKEEYLSLKNEYSAALTQKNVLLSKCEMAQKLLLQKDEEFNKFEKELLKTYKLEDENELFKKSQAYSPNISYSEIEKITTELSREIADLTVSVGNAEFEATALQKNAEDIISLEEQLQNKKACLEEKRAELKIICEAKRILEEASNEQRNNFAPKLAKKSGEIFAHLTENKHSEILIDKAFNAQYKLDGKYTDELYLSKGAIDQLYFSIRFGIIEMIKEKNVPVFLDDAFNQYDDLRLKTVLSFLCDYAKNSQVIISSCRKQGIEQISKNINIINL